MVPAIRNKYGFYRKLLREHKYVFRDRVEVVKTSQDPTYLVGRAYVSHIDLDTSISLKVCVKANDHNFFRFELRCEELGDLPFFEFHSDGCTHRNMDESIPLAEQRVTTPHFHRYNPVGVNMAYKTEQLEQENERKALEDINLGIIHFCHEAKLNLRDDEFPEISILPDALPLHVTQKDPNSTVLFL
ncbi:hypothetical protein [Larkinella soli]|uniref:hypothetical protein n=1 Tax=Larkinella soli TaxID=1770527 RepID=UPI000FFC1D7E|nr:hypothetical protein [Larkinella soli]